MSAVDSHGAALPGGAAADAAGEQREFFFSSDAAALVEHTKRVLILEDDELVHVAEGEYTLYQVGRRWAGRRVGWVEHGWVRW